MYYLYVFLAVLVPMTVLDFLWLGLVAKGFYQKHLGFLLASEMPYTPIVLFYLIYAAAIVYLAVLPALSESSVATALLRGAVLGMAAYAAYDLTNHATIANWPTIVSVTDVLWGMFVTAVASAAAYLIMTSIAPYL